LHHLQAVERRRLYAARGFSSLFEYCVKELGYAEAIAHRRISSMRLLSVLSQAQTFFRNEKISNKKEVLGLLENKTTCQVEKILVSMSTQPVIQERVRAISEIQSEVRFTASDELLLNLEKLRGLRAHKHPHASILELIGIALKMAVEKLDPSERVQKPFPAQKPTRIVNQALKTFIWKRDQSRCTYEDPRTKRRCTSQHALEMDPITPYALGGATTVENLRLLCRAHNLYEAQKIFGKLEVVSKI